jgi:hypothetical protein
MIPVCDSGNEMLFMKISYLASVIFVILYQSGIHENWLPDIPSLHAICMYHMYHVFHYVSSLDNRNFMTKEMISIFPL